jgi:EAL domain-containing protein (putative c-di-GMP-specific phosphodiesterase class I)
LPPLTRWLVCEIERLAEGWRARDLEPVAISINVSGGGLVRDDVLADLADAASRGALADGRLGIEITEDAMFGRNAEAVLERLRLLRERGMPIAIDDFGTGYASLSHLGRIPFDRLKIAGGFINQLGTNANAAAVVRTIVELAQRMGGRAVATCVESEEQLRFLRRHRCDEAQGYRFCGPLAADATESYLMRERELRAVR